MILLLIRPFRFEKVRVLPKFLYLDYFFQKQLIQEMLKQAVSQESFKILDKYKLFV